LIIEESAAACWRTRTKIGCLWRFVTGVKCFVSFSSVKQVSLWQVKFMINRAAGRLLPGNHPLSMNFSKAELDSS
jgi:hypothetical protein